MKTTEPPVIAEQLFSASKEAVWNAIAEHEQMTEWYFDN